MSKRFPQSKGKNYLSANNAVAQSNASSFFKPGMQHGTFNKDANNYGSHIGALSQRTAIKNSDSTQSLFFQPKLISSSTVQKKDAITEIGSANPTKEQNKVSKSTSAVFSYDKTDNETVSPVLNSPPENTSQQVSVNRIDIIDSPKGAALGYAPTRQGYDLNSPGPTNIQKDGFVAVLNVHQIHFYLDKGNSNMLIPRREIQRVSTIGGVTKRNDGPDGPATREILRPSANKIVIADAPGSGLTDAQYPYSYHAHFALTVAEKGGNDIARARYQVRIEKRNALDVPNKENRIFGIMKEDLVRNRSI